MALKATLDSLDGLDDALKALYTKQGDVFVLDIDDSEYKKKISEFRNNNIELSKKLEDLSKEAGSVEELKQKLEAFGDLDPAIAADAVQKMQGMEEKKLLDAGEFDKLFDQRTDRMKKDYEAQVRALTEQLEKTENSLKIKGDKLSEVVIDNSLQQTVSGIAPVRSGAMQDVLSRGRSIWKLDENGNPVPYGPDGSPLYGSNGKEPMSMKEWATDLVEQCPYLFEDSSGGGSRGNNQQQQRDGKVVMASDSNSLSANLEGIATGDVQVVVGD